MENYKVQIFENDVCIDTAIVTKEKAIQVQDCLKDKTVYLDRLKQQYKETFRGSQDDKIKERRRYLAVRFFCLDCNLVSFNDIEVMEFEVNNSFI